MKKLLTSLLLTTALLLLSLQASAWDHISIHANFNGTFDNWGYDQNLSADEVTINVDASSFTNGQTYQFRVRGSGSDYFTSSSLSFDFTSTSEIGSTSAATVLTKQEGTMSFKHNSAYSSNTFYLKYGTHWGTTGWYIKVTGVTSGGGGGGSSTTTLPANTSDGLYLVGNFFNTDGSTINTSNRIFKFDPTTTADSYKLDFPATVNANVRLLYVVGGNVTEWAPNLNTSITAGIISSGGNKTYTPYQTSDYCWQLSSRNDNNSEHEDDGIYEITVKLNPSTKLPSSVTFTHNPLRRVAYFISTEPGATAQPVYDSRDNTTSNFSNKTWGRIRFNSSYGLYVIGNVIHDNEDATIGMTSSTYGTHKNLKNTSILPTTNKLFLEGNGGRDFSNQNPYNEVSPNEDAIFPTITTGLYTVEYNPSNGNNEDAHATSPINHLGIRGQIQMKDGGADDPITSVSMVGPAITGTTSGDTWNWDSTAGDMTWDATERCYKLTLRTYGEEEGKDFRFVINRTQDKNLYETGSRARVPYTGRAIDHPNTVTCEPTDPNYVAYTTNGTGEFTADDYNIQFNRPAGEWTVRLYMVTEMVNNNVTRTYYYTIDGMEVPNIDLKPESMNIPFVKSEDTEVSLRVKLSSATYYKYEVYINNGANVAKETPVSYTDNSTGMLLGKLSLFPDGNPTSDNFYVGIFDGSNNSILTENTYDITGNDEITVRVKVYPTDEEGNVLIGEVYDEATYTFYTFNATATPSSGFYINEKEVTVTYTDTHNSADDIDVRYIVLGDMESPMTSTDVNEQKYQTLPANGKITLSGNPVARLYVKATLKSDDVYYTQQETSLPENATGEYQFTYSTSENYKNYLNNEVNTIPATNTGFTVFVYVDNENVVPEIRFKVVNDDNPTEVKESEWMSMYEMEVEHVKYYVATLPYGDYDKTDDSYIITFKLRDSSNRLQETDYSSKDVRNHFSYYFTVAEYTVTESSVYDYYENLGGSATVNHPMNALQSLANLSASASVVKSPMCPYYYHSVHDCTNLLDPTWGGSTDITDVSNSLSSWNGTTAEKQVLKVAPGATLTQTITPNAVKYNGNDVFYAVQAIVRRADSESTAPVKLLLGGATQLSDNGADSDTYTKGAFITNSKEAQNVVNPYGRVEAFLSHDNKKDGIETQQWRANDNEKWFKLEARATLDMINNTTNKGTLQIEIVNEGSEDLYLADVVVVPTEDFVRTTDTDGNPTYYPYSPMTSGEYISDGSGSGEPGNTTGKDFYTTTVPTSNEISDHEILPYNNVPNYGGTEIEINFARQTKDFVASYAPRRTASAPTETTPYFGHNAYSFFDRGRNLNAVVFAPKYTVIGMEPGLLTDDDETILRRHPVNVAAAQPQYIMDDIYSGSYYSYNIWETPFTMATLMLTDTDGSQWGNDHTYGTNYPFLADKVFFDRVASKGQRSTLMLPFSLTDTQMKIMFGDNYQAYKFSEINSDEKLVMTEVTGQDIAANTPFVFVINDGDATRTLLPATNDPAIINANVETSYYWNMIGNETKTMREYYWPLDQEDPSQPDLTGGGFFMGLYKFTDGLGSDSFLDTNTYKVYLYSPSKDLFSFATANADIRPFRALFIYQLPDNSTPTRRLNVVWDENVTTGITLAGDGHTVETVYDLQGRRYPAGSKLTKGVYIINGKKTIVK